MEKAPLPSALEIRRRYSGQNRRKSENETFPNEAGQVHVVVYPQFPPDTAAAYCVGMPSDRPLTGALLSGRGPFL